MSDYESKIVSQEIKRVIDFPLHPIAQLVHGKDTPANFSLFDIEIAPTALEPLPTPTVLKTRFITSSRVR